MTERSNKQKALTRVFSRPWWEVAIEAAGEPVSQQVIARRWTAAVQAVYPHIRYSQQDVCRIIGRARVHQDPLAESAPSSPVAA